MAQCLSVCDHLPWNVIALENSRSEVIVNLGICLRCRIVDAQSRLQTYEVPICGTQVLSQDTSSLLYSAQLMFDKYLINLSSKEQVQLMVFHYLLTRKGILKSELPTYLLLTVESC